MSVTVGVAPGTGVIAGGSIRVVLEGAGVKDILTKSLGSRNKINTARAAVFALSQLKGPKKQLVEPEPPPKVDDTVEIEETVTSD